LHLRVNIQHGFCVFVGHLYPKARDYAIVQKCRKIVSNENETYVTNNSSMLGPIIPKDEFLMSRTIETFDYKNSGFLRLLNMILQIFN